MSSSSTPPASPSFSPSRSALDDILGPMLVGLILASCLWGVIVQQAYRYYRNFPSDPWMIRGLVIATLLTETAQQASLSYGAFHILVTHYGNLAEEVVLNASTSLALFFTGTTEVLVKMFFLFRIHRLSNGKVWLVLPIFLVVVTEFGLVYAFAAFTATKKSVVQLGPFLPVTTALDVLSASGDIMIFSALCWLLLPQRKELFPRSRHLVDRVMMFATANGLLTCLCALSVLVTSLRLTKQGWTNIPLNCLGRLHMNALLTTLNLRENPYSNHPTPWHSVGYMSSDDTGETSKSSHRPSRGVHTLSIRTEQRSAHGEVVKSDHPDVRRWRRCGHDADFTNNHSRSHQPSRRHGNYASCARTTRPALKHRMKLLQLVMLDHRTLSKLRG